MIAVPVIYAEGLSGIFPGCLGLHLAQAIQELSGDLQTGLSRLCYHDVTADQDQVRPDGPDGTKQLAVCLAEFFIMQVRQKHQCPRIADFFRVNTGFLHYKMPALISGADQADSCRGSTSGHKG